MTVNEQKFQEKVANDEFFARVSIAEYKMKRRKEAYEKRLQEIGNAFCFYDPRNGLFWIVWMITAVFMLLGAHSFKEAVLGLVAVNAIIIIFMAIFIRSANQEYKRRMEEIG